MIMIICGPDIILQLLCCLDHVVYMFGPLAFWLVTGA